MDPLSEQIEIKAALTRFQHILAMQQEANKIAQQRISFIYKMVIMGFLLILITFAGTAFVMSNQMHKGTDSLKFMNQNMGKISMQMSQMQTTLTGMNQDMASLNQMVSQINTMTHSMKNLSLSMNLIEHNMQLMDQQVKHISQSMQQTNQEFYQMKNHIGVLNQNVHTLSKPMRLFNNLNPFAR